MAAAGCLGLEKAFAWLRMTFPPPMPIVIVAGNHSFYRRALNDELALGQALASDYDVVFLENSTGGVRFLGCVAWTDYALFGDEQVAGSMVSARGGPGGPSPHHMVEAAMAAVPAGGGVRASPAIARLPRGGTIRPSLARDPLSPAYASNLSDLIEAGRPTLWIHGHVHSSVDHWIAGTRIVCNPHGYGTENPAFDPNLIIEAPAATLGAADDA